MSQKIWSRTERMRERGRKRAQSYGITIAATHVPTHDEDFRDNVDEYKCYVGDMSKDHADDFISVFQSADRRHLLATTSLLALCKMIPEEFYDCAYVGIYFDSEIFAEADIRAYSRDNVQLRGVAISQIDDDHECFVDW